MNRESKVTALVESLERAAKQLGDITPHVMQVYYQRHPAARASFLHHHPANPAKLEGEMVEQVLYCLMEWFESPGEIEIVLITTVPHHIETLHVPVQFFTGLMEAVCDVIVATIPAGHPDERTVWQDLQRELTSIVETSAQFAQVRPRAA